MEASITAPSRGRREVIAANGPCDRDALIKFAATTLGFHRVSAKVHASLHRAILTAVRRQVLSNQNDELSICWSSIADFDRGFLKDQFLASISQNGRVWTDREEAIRTFARWLGYRRTGSVIEESARSLIRGLLQEGRLEKRGEELRRI